MRAKKKVRRDKETEETALRTYRGLYTQMHKLIKIDMVIRTQNALEQKGRGPRGCGRQGASRLKPKSGKDSIQEGYDKVKEEWCIVIWRFQLVNGWFCEERCRRQGPA